MNNKCRYTDTYFIDLGEKFAHTYFEIYVSQNVPRWPPPCNFCSILTKVMVGKCALKSQCQ